MRKCMECGKNLGIFEGYRHPTMGKDYLLCGNCFDTISISVDKWSNFIVPYVEFFNKESSKIDDIQNIRKFITKNVKNKLNYILLNKSDKDTNEIFPNIN